MKILALDSSGMVASAAVVEDDKILAEFNVNNKKNHSVTLLPMIETLQRILELELETLDAVAVSKGPGSFTGLRIGSATAKGLALALGKPIIEISSLEAMAYQIYGTDKLVCPIMDARRAQVYTGVYRNTQDGISAVLEDRAAAVEELVGYLNLQNEPVIFLGDGVPVYRDILKEKLFVPYEFAPAFQNRQRAAALGVLAVRYAAEGRMISSEKHRPDYLRMSQAERERMERSDA
jgi:tRNA threonylcarbamoyladenosine biosynthesis protein TsaB